MRSAAHAAEEQQARPHAPLPLLLTPSPRPPLAGGFLQLRTGLKSAGKSAVFGGVLLAMIEGVGILLTRVTAPPPAPGGLDCSVQNVAGLGLRRCHRRPAAACPCCAKGEVCEPHHTSSPPCFACSPASNPALTDSRVSVHFHHGCAGEVCEPHHTSSPPCFACSPASNPALADSRVSVHFHHGCCAVSMLHMPGPSPSLPAAVAPVLL